MEVHHGENMTEGLPPNAWGPPLADRWQAQVIRSTPTCVGTTTPARQADPPPWVYPHMRGDHDIGISRWRAEAGLPPHAWGPRHADIDGQTVAGSTPTCVGTTPGSGCHPSNRTVYPHMRGDHAVCPPGEVRQLGLPPHAWGPRRAGPGTRRRRRSTPTCVGTTAPDRTPASSASVYPHMRGDHRFTPGSRAPAWGLPPHAWGPLVRPPCIRGAGGSTPTCVGTTLQSRPSASLTVVYPHMRGDHTLPDSRWTYPCGLPPHAWGPPSGQRDRALAHGSTPTCVGTTLTAAGTRTGDSVYPHMRGDHR